MGRESPVKKLSVYRYFTPESGRMQPENALFPAAGNFFQFFFDKDGTNAVVHLSLSIKHQQMGDLFYYD